MGLERAVGVPEAVLAAGTQKAGGVGREERTGEMRLVPAEWVAGIG